MFPGFDRRRFLKGTTGLGATTALVTLGGLACDDEPPARTGEIRHLSPEQAATLTVLVDTVFPGEGELPAGSELGIVQRIDAALGEESEILRAKFLDAILFLEWTPQFSFHFGRFSRLGPAARTAVFEGFAASRWTVKRSVYTALKGLVAFFYADSPAVWPHMGYDGTWVPREGTRAGADPATEPVPAATFASPPAPAASTGGGG